MFDNLLKIGKYVAKVTTKKEVKAAEKELLDDGATIVTKVRIAPKLVAFFTAWFVQDEELN